MRNLIRKIFFIRVFWIFFLAHKRLFYLFQALHSGIKRNRGVSTNIFNLRRNIHKIEKGLIFPDTKKVFAESYILATVKNLQKLILYKIIDAATLTWSVAVLNKYFNVCKSDVGNIKNARELFYSLNLNNTSPNNVPYHSSDRPFSNITYKDLYTLALRRRSVRFFLEKKVKSEVIKKALKVAVLSPSACNRQSFKFLFFNEMEFVKKISDIPGGVKGYGLPSIIVVIGKYNGYFDERDIFAPIIDSSLAAMTLQFSLETLGLSSVCINWPNIREKDREIRKLISLEKDEFVVMMLGVGYPDPNGKIPYSGKRPVDNLLFINQK